VWVHPITAADLLNDCVLPFFEEHDVRLLRVLTDRGSEFCGNPERHEYELYLAIEDIDHSRTKTRARRPTGRVILDYFKPVQVVWSVRLSCQISHKIALHGVDPPGHIGQLRFIATCRRRCGTPSSWCNFINVFEIILLFALH
jgi:hypothetical protein